MRRPLLILAGAAAVAAGGFFLLRAPAVEVAVAPVVRGPAINVVPGSVFIAAEIEMDVRAEVAGRVQASELRLGAAAAQEAPLVRLDPRDVELAIARIEIDLAAARERRRLGSPTRQRLLNVEDEVANFERQTRAGQYPEAELEKRRRELEQVRQAVANEETALAQAVAVLENELLVRQREREKMTLRAPMDGVITRVLAFPGELLATGQPVARIVSAARTVEARVSEENAAKVEVGQDATVRLPSFPDEIFRARVSKVLPTANPETQRYSVYLDVEMDLARLRPGLTGEAAIVVGRREHALVIPRRALVGSGVLVVRGGRLEEVEVKPGFIGLNDVEVLAGLHDGDVVVVERLESLRPGQRVRAAAGS